MFPLIFHFIQFQFWFNLINWNNFTFYIIWVNLFLKIILFKDVCSSILYFNNWSVHFDLRKWIKITSTFLLLNFKLETQLKTVLIHIHTSHSLWLISPVPSTDWHLLYCFVLAVVITAQQFSPCSHGNSV